MPTSAIANSPAAAAPMPADSQSRPESGALTTARGGAMGCGLVGHVGGPGSVAATARGRVIGCGFAGHVGGPASVVAAARSPCEPCKVPACEAVDWLCVSAATAAAGPARAAVVRAAASTAVMGRVVRMTLLFCGL